MVVVPNTNIILLKTPFEMDEENTLTFANATAQYNYFTSLPKLELENATYQRKDGVIRWAGSYDDIIEYNYCMYQNESFSNKWFYAFIEDIKFVSTEVTEIKIKTDVYQCWQFDITWKKCFVEREHVNNDTIGIHTVPENLETGEYIINSIEEIDVRSGNYFIAMAVSEVPTSTPGVTNDRTYGGIYSGLTYFLFDSATNCSKMIEAYDNLGRAEGIYSIFMLPTSLSFSNTWYTATLGGVSDIKFAVAQTSSTPVAMVTNKTIAINTTLNGYTPTNQKLKCYPYNYLYITNNSGSDSIYKYEDFTGTPNFNVDGVITTGCSIKLYPTNYKKYTNANWQRSEYCYGINGGKYPTCSWSSDSYTNWLTQNAVNIPLQIGASVLTTIGGIVGGNAVTGASGILGIASTLGSVYEHSLMPDQAKGNVNSGDVTASAQMIGFYAYKMSIKQEYAKIIDNFFSMYGYKVNDVKLPNITGRTNWNFVKTINCNITGNIPQKDLLEIKELFDKGITLWHNPTTFLDYSQSNTIVT